MAQFTELHAAVTVWSAQSNIEFQLTPIAAGITHTPRWKRKDRFNSVAGEGVTHTHTHTHTHTDGRGKTDLIVFLVKG